MEQVNNALEISSMSFSYNGSTVLDGISLNVKQGSLCFILGRNGSGKSTLLRIIAGLLKPQEGKLSLFGTDSDRLSGQEKARLAGYLNQQHNPVFPFSVEDVVLTGRASYVNFIPGPADIEAVDRALDKTAIQHLRRRNYNELSGGEQQLVMIARLLAQAPRLMLLDEPTTFLDVANQSYLLDLLKTLSNEGMTIMAAVHDPNLALLWGDDLIFMKEGRAIRTADPVKATDPGFLAAIFDDSIEAIPYMDRAVLVPRLSR